MNKKSIFWIIIIFFSFFSESRVVAPGSLKGNAAGVIGFTVTPSKKNFASALSDNTVRIWNSYNKNYNTLSEFSAKITKLEFSPDESRLAVAEGNSVSFWTSDGKKINEFICHSEWIRSISFTLDGKYFITGSEDNTIKFWGLDGRLIKTFTGHEDNVNAIAVSPDQRTFVSGDEDGFIILWDFEDGEEIKRFQAHDVSITGLAFSPSGDKILSSSHNDNINIFNLKGEKISELKGHTSSVRDIEFSPDGNLLVSSGDDGTVKVWGKKYEILQNFELHNSSVTAIKFISKNKILSAGLDGNQFILDVVSGKTIGKIVLTEMGKIVYVNDGRFEYDVFHSLNEVSFIDSKTDEEIGLEKIHDSFYTPGLLNAILQDKLELKDTDISEIIKKSPPPEVKILSHKIEKDNAVLEVQACDRGGGVRDIYLYQNEVLVSLSGSRDIKIIQSKKCVTKQIHSGLVEGINSFRATAKNKTGIEGFSEFISLSYSRDEKDKPDLHIIAIAIDEYKNRKLSLKYAVKDAEAITKKLSESSKRIYRNIYTYKVYNSDATREGILKSFKDASKKTRIQDIAIIFIAGHGFSENRKYYFLEQDNPANNETIMKKAINQSELVESISLLSANKKLVILDTCESGGDWLVALRGIDEQVAINVLAKTAGIWVIAASQENQYALESTKTGHGLLTSALLEAFENKSRVGGKLTVGNLIPWINKRVPELAKSFFNWEQYPYTVQKGQDFPLGE